MDKSCAVYYSCTDHSSNIFFIKNETKNTVMSYSLNCNKTSSLHIPCKGMAIRSWIDFCLFTSICNHQLQL